MANNTMMTTTFTAARYGMVLDLDLGFAEDDSNQNKNDDEKCETADAAAASKLIVASGALLKY